MKASSSSGSSPGFAHIIQILYLSHFTGEVSLLHPSIKISKLDVDCLFQKYWTTRI